MDSDTIHYQRKPSTNQENPWHQNEGQVEYFEANVNTSVNRYKYVKSNITKMLPPSKDLNLNTSTENVTKNKILINPNFRKKVFVNPNFNPQETNTQPISTVVHVNAKIYNPKFFKTDSSESLKPASSNRAKKILVNPNVISNSEYLNDVLQLRLLESEITIGDVPTEFTVGQTNVISSITSNDNLVNPANTGTRSTTLETEDIPVISQYSLVRSHSMPNTVTHIKSKYKIVKNTVKSQLKSVKSPNILYTSTIRKRRKSVKSLYRIVKSSVESTSLPKKLTAKRKSLSKSKPFLSKYKKDNRIATTSISKPLKKKYMYINKFLSIGEIAKSTVIKKSPILKMSVTNKKIGGLTYKTSTHSLRRTFSNESNSPKSGKLGVKDLSKSNKYKLIRRNSKTKLENEKVGKIVAFKKTRRLSERTFNVKKFKIVKRDKRSLSPKKLKKCNIPCAFYRKYGTCKAHENSKCFRKHDPDQIALCTKFLQGACVKENCKLSHKVLPEKMPTCKFYLEGSCSKDNCQYLHVKINPKADICRDFIEGFCAKAAECDKRHQYLCPEYEKYGKCPKQRCEYPHGNMVRNYYLENKNKFVKKPFGKDINKNATKPKDDTTNNQNITIVENSELDTNSDTGLTSIKDVCKESTARYYEEKQSSQSNVENNIEHEIKDFRSRPKLGALPTFIPFS